MHVVGEAEGKRPLILSHGWPGSHYEFWGAIDKLALPSRHGGDAADAFDLVIPSLPGFGFSSKPAKPFGQRQTARLFNTLMTEVLGYERYLAQGGDWGSLVTSSLAYDHPKNVRAIHLNMLGFRPPGGPKGEAEAAWMTRQGAAMDALGAYFRLQVSKPQSLAWLGAGNPVGQAAWIVERFYDWSRPAREAVRPGLQPRSDADQRDDLRDDRLVHDRRLVLPRTDGRRRRAAEGRRAVARRPPPSPTSPAKRSTPRRRGRTPSAPTTSSAGARCPAAATSPPWRSPTSSSMT